MEKKTQHTDRELLVRARIALGNSELIEFVEEHERPRGAQKAAEMLGYNGASAYSTWALAALKRDYPEIYTELQAVKDWRSNNNRMAPTGNAEKAEVKNEVAI